MAGPNIVWVKPDGQVAVTILSAPFPRQAYADKLKATGSVPSEWKAMAFDAVLPDAPQDTWVWNGAAVVVDTAKQAAIAAEQARSDGVALEISADPLVERLRNATVSEIKAWVASSVTDLAGARTILMRIAIVLAALLRR
jgi:hypothetical protein